MGPAHLQMQALLPQLLLLLTEGSAAAAPHGLYSHKQPEHGQVNGHVRSFRLDHLLTHIMVPAAAPFTGCGLAPRHKAVVGTGLASLLGVFRLRLATTWQKPSAGLGQQLASCLGTSHAHGSD